MYVSNMFLFCPLRLSIASAGKLEAHNARQVLSVLSTSMYAKHHPRVFPRAKVKVSCTRSTPAPPVTSTPSKQKRFNPSPHPLSAHRNARDVVRQVVNVKVGATGCRFHRAPAPCCRCRRRPARRAAAGGVHVVGRGRHRPDEYPALGADRDYDFAVGRDANRRHAPAVPRADVHRQAVVVVPHLCSG